MELPLHDPEPFWAVTPEPTPDPSAPKRRPPRKKTAAPAPAQLALPTPPLDPGSPQGSVAAFCPSLQPKSAVLDHAPSEPESAQAGPPQIHGQASGGWTQPLGQENGETGYGDIFTCTYDSENDHDDHDNNNNYDDDEDDDGHGGDHPALAAAGFPGQAAHLQEVDSPFLDCYLSEDTDDESGGAHLPQEYLGMSSKHAAQGAQLYDYDDEVDISSADDEEQVDVDSASEHGHEQDAYESALQPFVDMPSSVLEAYMHASYSAVPSLTPQGEPSPIMVPGLTFDTAAHAAHIETATHQAAYQQPPVLVSGSHVHSTGGGGTIPIMDAIGNTNFLAPGNMSLQSLVFSWVGQPRHALRSLYGEDTSRPCFNSASAQLLDSNKPFRVEYGHLEGDRCDLQGIDWEAMGVSRQSARDRRLMTYRNFVHERGSDKWRPEYPDVHLPSTDDFFRFKRMDIRKNGYLAHFQLRNLVACTAPNQIFYTGQAAVHSFDPRSKSNETALKSTENPDCPLSTMDAAHNVLVAGNFVGEYMVRRLGHDTYDQPSQFEGTLTSSSSAITNHVQLYMPRRSSAPQACFASNDAGLRILDIATNTVLSETMFDFPINCTAVSPDGQLRVMVGDQKEVLVVPADGSRINVVGSAFGGADAKAQAERQLPGHRDHGFACAWADDGHTIATGFQDQVVKIWDARNWHAPVATIRTHMAGARSLRFSPVGSGRRVLVAAEEADYINIIDACTFRSKQTIDFFGEIGGVAFEPTEGRDLYAFVTDPARGGIMQLERCSGIGALSNEMMQYRPQRQRPGGGSQDSYGAEKHAYRGGGFSDARWRPPAQVPSQWQQQQQQQQQQHRWQPQQKVACSQRRAWDSPPATSSSDWPQGSMSAATRKNRRAQARRRHREAVLDCFDGL
ncbi:WD-40 repeat family protein [Gaeumannomyces tritici R3-111a-1]|uniref:WD-40 repeat family protein n=1 Tax=Gaeumannomyces tritici (strain R3-111a-1) TaxID=644352 RepID=J3PFB3_GAET3|nr:WD-40 repeat family protein [Gaeumannomyces tritici R3-111a-1]EJT70015.1 WD-40 repeat family protein [Gaeumannomyces tritici R3-111a-1]